MRVPAQCLACDFGGSSVKYALVDEHAQLSNRGRLPAPLGSVQEFQDAVGELAARFGDQIAGVGISLPGYIDPDRGVLIGSGVYEALHGRCIPELLRDVCPLPVAVENDGKCGALSEAWDGALRQVRVGAVIILGSGIAGGIIKDGHVHYGKGFAAGEFSYLITGGGTHTYRDMAMWHAGMLGVTYKLCKLKNLDLGVQDSSSVLMTLDEDFAGRFPTFPQPPAKQKAGGHEFIAWVESGDPVARQVYREFIDALAVLIFNVQTIYGPDRIVIGGGLSRSPRILADVAEELDRYYVGCGTNEGMRSEVVPSRYLDECNLVGAAHNFFQRYATPSSVANRGE